MGRSEALKQAQKRYMARIKGSPKGLEIYEKIKALNRESFKKKYSEDEDFRLAKNEYCRTRKYYTDFEAGCFKAIRKLFGEHAFFGR
jgi:hypothetical protein